MLASSVIRKFGNDGSESGIQALHIYIEEPQSRQEPKKQGTSKVQKDQNAEHAIAKFYAPGRFNERQGKREWKGTDASIIPAQRDFRGGKSSLTIPFHGLVCRLWTVNNITLSRLYMLSSSL